MAIVVNYPDTIYILPFDSRSTFSKWPQSNAVPDNIQTFDSLSLGYEAGAQLNATFHDADR